MVSSMFSTQQDNSEDEKTDSSGKSFPPQELEGIVHFQIVFGVILTSTWAPVCNKGID